MLTGFSKGFIGGLAATGAVFIAALGKTFKEGKEAAEELLDSSRMSSSNTRDTMFEWGTNRAGAYGVNQAMDIMGYTSQEDLMWASSEEQKKFMEIQNKFADKYLEMQESGKFDELLETQIEMAELEKDIQMREAEFYAENEDSIKAIKEASLKIKEVTVKIFGGISKWINNLGFGHDDVAKADTAKATEILQNYATTTNNNQRSTNIRIDNSFNNQAGADQTSVETALSNFFNVVDAAIS